MRFMIIRRADKDTEAGVMPTEQLFSDMMKYNEGLVKAGVMLAGEGLHPSSKGARVKFSNGKPLVIDGPFTETKELIAGYTLIQVRSVEEAQAWASRFPMPFVGMACEIEVRRLYEDTDFAPGGDMAIRSE